jgi:hypothetical protein
VFNNGGLVIGVAMGSVESGQSLNFARSAGAVRAMLQSKQGFTTLSDLNKTPAKKEQAKTGPTTSLRPTPKPRLVYASDVSDGLKRFISGYAAKSPDNKFHIPYQRKDLALDLVKLHDDRFSNLGGDKYFACVDMKGADGKIYDIDFFMLIKPGKLTLRKHPFTRSTANPYTTGSKKAAFGRRSAFRKL